MLGILGATGRAWPITFNTGDPGASIFEQAEGEENLSAEEGLYRRAAREAKKAKEGCAAFVQKDFDARSLLKPLPIFSNVDLARP